MFSHVSDSQTLHTLRSLSENGMLLQGSLDPQVAADLLNGTENFSGLNKEGEAGEDQQNGSTKFEAKSGLPKRGETPTRLAPLQGSGKMEAAAAAAVEAQEMDGNQGESQLSEGFVQQLSQDCDNFRATLRKHTDNTQDLLHKTLVEEFIRISQDKLPDCFLRSLPKFGRGANKMAVIFNKSSNRKKTDSIVDKKELPFELQITDEVQDEVSGIVQTKLGMELQRFYEQVSTEVQSILNAVLQLRKRLQTVEEGLLREKTELRVLRERLTDTTETSSDQEKHIERLTEQAKQKDMQMDILREQVLRRNKMLDDARAAFNQELNRARTKLFEYKHKLDSANEDRHGGGGRRSSLGGGGGGVEFDSTPQAATDMQVMEAVDTATMQLRETMLENMSKLKADHAREKKDLLQQKKIAISERDNTIYHLKLNVKSMDRIVEVEKRRMMKNREMEMKEIQEKYEQKIAVLQAEVTSLKQQLGK